MYCLFIIYILCISPSGVATNVIHLMNGMETWDMKLASSLNGTMPIHDMEWGGLCQLMEDWLSSITEAVEYVGSTQREESRAEGLPHTRSDWFWC